MAVNLALPATKQTGHSLTRWGLGCTLELERGIPIRLSSGLLGSKMYFQCSSFLSLGTLPAEPSLPHPWGSGICRLSPETLWENKGHCHFGPGVGKMPSLFYEQGQWEPKPTCHRILVVGDPVRSGWQGWKVAAPSALSLLCSSMWGVGSGGGVVDCVPMTENKYLLGTDSFLSCNFS